MTIRSLFEILLSSHKIEILIFLSGVAFTALVVYWRKSDTLKTLVLGVLSSLVASVLYAQVAREPDPVTPPPPLPSVGGGYREPRPAEPRPEPQPISPLPRSSSDDGTIKPQPPQANNTEELLRDTPHFSVYTFGFSATEKDVNFSIRIQNKTDKELYLGWERGELIITDDSGMSASPWDTTMASVTRSENRTSVHTLIGPAAAKTISMRFPRAKITGKQVTLSANIHQVDGEKQYNYSIHWTKPLPTT